MSHDPLTPHRLTGRVLVTGAASGIGAATARLAASLGAEVIVAGRRVDQRLRSVAEPFGARAVAVDVTDEDSVAEAIGAVSPLAGLVNCAGSGGYQPLLTTDLADWRRTVAVDLDGSFLCLRAAAKGMLAAGVDGSIVNVSSINARFAHRGFGPYAAAKGGLDQLTKVAALELAQSGIRVNGVAPEAVDTPMLASAMADQATARRLIDDIPLGRVATPDDIAEIICWLLSDASRWITGQTILADGGASLRVEPRLTADSAWTREALAAAAGALDRQVDEALVGSRRPGPTPAADD